MKEATGELNLSVIVITSVAILSAFFYFTLWPMISENQEQQVACSHAICSKSADGDGYVDCSYSYTKNGSTRSGTTKCKYKG